MSCYSAIWYEDLRNPETRSLLIECTVQDMGGRDKRRLYECKYNPRNYYFSQISGGTKVYTTNDKGTSGEEIAGKTTYTITSDDAHVGEFENWDQVMDFFCRMRARSLVVVEE